MRLIKGNVERIPGSELQEQQLLADGYKRVDSPPGPAESAGENPDKPLGEMTVDELRAYAKEKGVSGYYSLNKAELLMVLEDVD